MKITTKELRIQPGKILDQVANGEEVTVTFRGRALAKIVPIGKTSKTGEKDDIPIFGLWKEHEDIKDVENYVRVLRKARQF